MKYCLAIVGIALLTGCAAKVTPFNTAGGRPGFVVSCRNEDKGWAECYEAAAKACDGRYAVIDSHDNSHGSGRRDAERTLVVSCKRRGRDD